jgi:hypothetical protein
MTKHKPPKELDAIVDVVLAYRPKPKTKPAKKRRRMQKRIIADLASGQGKNFQKNRTD